MARHGDSADPLHTTRDFATSRVVVASAARTATGNSAALTLQDAGGRGPNVCLLLDVTAASGTAPTLDVSVEWSHDGGTTFAAAEPVDSFAQITAAKKAAKLFSVKGPVYRIRWAIAGTTPSFTFSVREFVAP